MEKSCPWSQGGGKTYDLLHSSVNKLYFSGTLSDMSSFETHGRAIAPSAQKTFDIYNVQCILFLPGTVLGIF